MKNDLFSKMSKVGDIAKKVSKRVAEDPKIREMGSQVTQKLTVAGKQIQDQMPSQAEISKRSEKTRDFTAKKLRKFSANIEHQKLQNLPKPENNRLSEMSKNHVNEPNAPKPTPTLPNQTTA